MQQIREYHKLTNDELAKLYYKEFPALGSKEAICESLFGTLDNCSTTAINDSNVTIDIKFSKQNVTKRREYGVFKRKKSINKRNGYENNEKWDMDFEGLWEMEEDPISEFLRNQKSPSHAEPDNDEFLYGQFNHETDNVVFNENINLLDMEISDLFSFLPSQLINEAAIDLPSQTNKYKDEGYITPDSSFFSFEHNEPDIKLSDVNLHTDGINNKMEIVNLNSLKSKFNQNVRDLWDNNAINNKYSYLNIETDVNCLDAKNKKIPDFFCQNDFIVSGTNLNHSIWSEHQNIQPIADSQKLKESYSDIHSLQVDVNKISIDTFREGIGSLRNDGNVQNSYNRCPADTDTNNNSSHEITLTNHSKYSSFVRVEASSNYNNAKTIKTKILPKTNPPSNVSKAEIENLLTSEKTHFRPIKETYLDGHTFQISYTPKKLNFVRSSSGLYLNCIKYFEFKEETEPDLKKNMIVKFCVKQNEKSSQTENENMIKYENIMNLERYICKKCNVDGNSQKRLGSSHNCYITKKSISLFCNPIDVDIWSPEKLKKCPENNNNYDNMWSQCSTCNMKSLPANNNMKAELISEGEELMYDLQCMQNLNLDSYSNLGEVSIQENDNIDSDIFSKVNKIVSELLNPETTKTLSDALDQTLFAANLHKNINVENKENCEKKISNCFATKHHKNAQAMKEESSRYSFFDTVDSKALNRKLFLKYKKKNPINDNQLIQVICNSEKLKEKRFDRKRRHSACQKLISFSSIDETDIFQKHKNLNFENMIEIQSYLDNSIPFTSYRNCIRSSNWRRNEAKSRPMTR